MTTTNSLTTRQKILQAANRLVLRDGVAHLTLEAVAKEAGVSKGGVLYHFASKDKLIEGMIGDLLERAEAGMAQAAANDPERTGRFVRSYLYAVGSQENAAEMRELTAGLLAAIATNRKLLEPLQERYLAWQKRIEDDGLPPEVATIVRLAFDGLWFSEILGMAPPAGEDRARVLRALIEMTRVPASQGSDSKHHSEHAKNGKRTTRK